MGRVQLFAILPSRDSRNIIGILSIMWRVEYIAATKDQILFAGLYLVYGYFQIMTKEAVIREFFCEIISKT